MSTFRNGGFTPSASAGLCADYTRRQYARNERIRDRVPCSAEKEFELSPIIFISAVNYSDLHLSRGYSLGAVDYILAPIVPEILRAKVSFFVELYRKTQQLKMHAEMQAQLIREQTARAQAEAANEAKDRFLAMLSHELRTPLAPVLFASSMFSRDQTLPDRVREAFNVIARNVQLEARLIEDQLDLTRVHQES